MDGRRDSIVMRLPGMAASVNKGSPMTKGTGGEMFFTGGDALTVRGEKTFMREERNI